MHAVKEFYNPAVSSHEVHYGLIIGAKVIGKMNGLYNIILCKYFSINCIRDKCKLINRSAYTILHLKYNKYHSHFQKPSTFCSYVAISQIAIRIKLTACPLYMYILSFTFATCPVSAAVVGISLMWRL